MKTLEDDWYVVIKAYKCTVSEIWRDFFVSAYIACTLYPYIQSLPTHDGSVVIEYLTMAQIHPDTFNFRDPDYWPRWKR